MIEYLQKIRGNNVNNLSEKDKLELEHLKAQLEKYKEIERQENQEVEASEGSDSGSGSEG